MSTITEQTTQVIERSASVATYGGSSTAILFGLSANEVAALGGLAVAIIGLLVNVWFQWRRDQRERDRMQDDDE